MQFINLTNSEELINYFKKEDLYKYLIKDLKKINKNIKFNNIFHYSNTKSLFNILEKEELWITRYDFLNDKSEGHYFWNLLFEIIKNEKIDSKFIKLLHQSIEFNKKINTYPIDSSEWDFFILSLSINPDSLTLWSNYSNNDGYCIGFNSSNVIKSIIKFNKEQNKKLEKDINVILNIDKIEYGKVIYDKNEQIKIINDELKDFKKEDKLTNDEKFLVLAVTFIERMRLYSFFFKNNLFKQEEEFRIVFSISKKNNEFINYRDRGSLVIPFIILKLDNIIKTNYIELIKIGPKNKEEICKLGLKKYLEKKKMNNVVIENSEIPLRYL